MIKKVIPENQCEKHNKRVYLNLETLNTYLKWRSTTKQLLFSFNSLTDASPILLRINGESRQKYIPIGLRRKMCMRDVSASNLMCLHEECAAYCNDQNNTAFNHIRSAMDN